MNNLEKAKRALSGKKKFRVEFSRAEYSYVDVEAADKEEAETLAYDLESEGNATSNGSSDLDVTEVKEID